jgi:hypothetical protein
MKKLVTMLAALGLAAGGVFASGLLSTGSAAVASTAPSITAARAKQLALEWAARANDAQPEVAVESATRGQAALALHTAESTGAVSNPGTSVYLVIMHGHFTLSDAPIPPGQAAPSGDVMKVEVLTSGQVDGLHVGNEE